MRPSIEVFRGVSGDWAELTLLHIGRYIEKGVYHWGFIWVQALSNFLESWNIYVKRHSRSAAYPTDRFVQNVIQKVGQDEAESLLGDLPESLLELLKHTDSKTITPVGASRDLFIRDETLIIGQI